MTTTRAFRGFLLGVFLALVNLTSCVQAPTVKPPPNRLLLLGSDGIRIEGDQSFLPAAKDYTSCPWQVKALYASNPEFFSMLEANRVFGEDVVFHYDEDLIKILETINDIGNKAITWKDDKFNWCVVERWAFPKLDADGKLYEDCEGIALWKMRELVRLGMPSSPLLITLVLSKDGTGHAILVARTDKGDFVLDNAHPKIRTVKAAQDAGYTFLMYPLRGSELDGTWVHTFRH